jgi:hypothetical protein
MPRAPAKIRRRYIEGQTEVLDWEIEETLVYGCTQIIGPPSMFHGRDEWRHAWDRWGDIVLPKSLEYRPGLRPFAMYAVGEIPPRELRMPLPADARCWSVIVRDRDGTATTHYLNAPEPFVENEVKHLRRLGIVDDREYQRHRRWMQAANPDCDACPVDNYPLEMSLYE